MDDVNWLASPLMERTTDPFEPGNALDGSDPRFWKLNGAPLGFPTNLAGALYNHYLPALLSVPRHVVVMSKGSALLRNPPITTSPGSVCEPKPNYGRSVGAPVPVFGTGSPGLPASLTS